jgi:hypothetical protein
VEPEGAAENADKKTTINAFYKNLMEKGKINKEGAPG